MSRGRWLTAVLLIAVFPLAGCGRSPARTTTPKAAKPAASIPLPEWAPKNPSPEFLRAARVIKPWPGEVTVARYKGDVAGRAWSEKYGRTLAAAWEFFGTLTDQQIEHFVKTKKLRLLVKDLNPKQRSAMYHYFDVWRESMKGVPVTSRISLARTGWSISTNSARRRICRTSRSPSMSAAVIEYG